MCNNDDQPPLQVFPWPKAAGPKEGFFLDIFWSITVGISIGLLVKFVFAWAIAESNGIGLIP